MANLGIGAARYIDGVGHQRRVTAHQGDTCGMHGDISAGRHGNANICSRQRWGIVEAVTHHGNGCAAFLELTHNPRLVCGQNFISDFIQTQLFTHCLRTAPVVSGDQNRPHALCPQAGNGRRGRWLERVAKGEQAQQGWLVRYVGYPGNGSPLCLQFIRLRGLCAQVDFQLVHEPCAAQAELALPHHGSHAPARDRADLGSRQQLQPVALGGIQHRAGQRVFAACLDGRARHQKGGSVTVDSFSRHQRGFAFGERAGFVKRHHRHLVRHLQRLCVLDQNAMPSRNAGAGHDGGRRCQAQGTWACDDEHRDRVENRGLPVAGAQSPPQHG